MPRFTFRLPEELHARARELAVERGISFSGWVCEALEEYISRTVASPSRPKPRSLGMGASRRSDIGRRASELYEPDPWRS